MNEKGELLSFYLTTGNTDDRNPKVIQAMTRQLFGKLFGDKGYLPKALFDSLFADGIQLVTRLRKNMKGHIMSLNDKILLRKRALIETINDQLKKPVANRAHSLSCPVRFSVILGVLAAYSFFLKKPS